MTDVVICARNISKCYQIYDTPRDRLKQLVMPRLQRMAGRTPARYFRDFWALKDISFEIRKGESVGIIGRNGSGKSTLLQLICGILMPTTGTVETNGRISALLELGSGFNPAFTGRENVYMNGAVLGLSTKEIDARFDSIAAFADIGEFIDQPVKAYSSGMQVRLAFAVAINVDPQILVVDEALSVGDELFQRKCLSCIEAMKHRGVTILFVSHYGVQVIDLCDRALLVDSGELLVSGRPKHVIGQYQKLLYAPEQRRNEIRAAIVASVHSSFSQQPESFEQALPKTKETEPHEFYDPHLKPQSTIALEPKGALIEQPKVIALDGKQVNNLRRGQSYRYCYRVGFERHATRVRFGMLIKTVSGAELGGAVSASNAQSAIPDISAGTVVEVEFRFQCSLNPGIYFLNAGVVGVEGGEETYLHRLLDACIFRVLPESAGTSTGIVDFECIHEVTVLETA